MSLVEYELVGFGKTRLRGHIQWIPLFLHSKQCINYCIVTLAFLGMENIDKLFLSLHNHVLNLWRRMFGMFIFWRVRDCIFVTVTGLHYSKLFPCLGARPAASSLFLCYRENRQIGIIVLASSIQHPASCIPPPFPLPELSWAKQSKAKQSKAKHPSTQCLSGILRIP